jgi:hypothetical protein
MVRQANPVPDPKRLTPVDAPVLTSVRRTDMQTDGRVDVRQGPQSRRRGLLVGAAVAAAILIGGAIFVMTRSDPPVAEPAPNATRLPDEVTTPLAPGTYFADADEDAETTLGGTFVIAGNGWSSLATGAIKQVPVGDGSYVSLLVVEVDRVWSQGCQGGVPEPAATSAEALAEQFVTPGMTTREALTPVSAFGHDGYHLVLEVPAGCDNAEGILWAGGSYPGRFYHAEGQVVEYWFLDIDGIPVMVEASWMAHSPEEDVAELRSVIDSLVITP